MNRPAIERSALLRVALPSTVVDEVDVRRIRFAPGQTTGLHRHSCPVVGLIVEGAAMLEIEGEAPRELPAGSAFHEPAGKRILRFDNASNEQPMTFVAVYLLRSGQPLIEML